MLDQLLSTVELRAALVQERIRLAQDLHDGVAQHLVHVLHKLELLQHLLEQEQCQSARLEADNAHLLLEAGVRDLRQIISSLLPEQQEAQDIVGTLRTFLHEYQISNPELKVTCAIHELYLLPAMFREPAFRLIQEALNNISKHAHATSAFVRICMLSTLFLVEVSDNGSGCQLEQVLSQRNAPGIQVGLHSMRTRIQDAGGCWEVQSQPGMGVTVRAYFPRS